MYKVTVIDQDREEHEYENVLEYGLIGGGFQLYHSDGSATVYAQGSWLEADVVSIGNPQAPPIEDGSVYGEQL